MNHPTEIQTKLDRVRAVMAEHGVGALWLRRVENVFWITGGIDTAVNTAGAFGVGSIVVTEDACTLYTNAIEVPRFRLEDQVEERGIELHASPWEGPQAIPVNNTLGTDWPMDGAVDLTDTLGRLRARLLPVEQERFRALGMACAEAMQRAINRVHPGNSENEIAAALAYETRIRNMTPVVVLVATDERIHNFRHPLPTPKIMDQYAMLVLCGRRDGLVCSVTRLVHFGKLPDDLRRRMEATAEVDAAMIAASQPGTALEDVFRVAQEAYARTGFDGEWKLHHQGGVAGYTPREALGVPGESMRLEPGMVCAWNPSITGAKSEDTIMVPEPGQAPAILTGMYAWPMRSIEINGQTIERPLIMEMD